MSGNTPIPSQQSEVNKTTLLTPSLYGGRFTRMQFWCYSLLGGLFAGAVEFLLGDLSLGRAILLLYTILYALPITVKRCHDIGESGFMLLPFITPSLSIYLFICFIVIFGNNNVLPILPMVDMLYGIMLCFSAFFSLFLMLKLGFEDSEKGTNKYGPSNKYPDTAA